MSTDNETSEQSYRADVSTHADTIVQAIRDSDNYKRFDINEAVDEECEGSWWTTSTYAARACLLHSKNEDAIFEHMGSDALAGKEGMSQAYSAAAYYALHQDILDELESRGSVNDPSSFLTMCDECGDEPVANDGEMCDGCTEAKEEEEGRLDAIASRLSRDECVRLLEGASIQCYLDEDTATLREAVAANLKDGTIGESDIEG